MDYNDFIAFEENYNKAIRILPIYIDVTNDLISGLLLSQIVYWNMPSKKTKKKRSGEWLVKRREDWWDEIRITPKQFDRAIKILKDLNLVEVERKKSPFHNYQPTTHIKLNQNELMNKINIYLENQKIKNSEIDKIDGSELPKKSSLEVDQKDVSELPQRSSSEINQKGNSQLDERGSSINTINTSINTNTINTPINTSISNNVNRSNKVIENIYSNRSNIVESDFEKNDESLPTNKNSLDFNFSNFDKEKNIETNKEIDKNKSHRIIVENKKVCEFTKENKNDIVNRSTGNDKQKKEIHPRVVDKNGQEKTLFNKIRQGFELGSKQITGEIYYHNGKEAKAIKEIINKANFYLESTGKDKTDNNLYNIIQIKAKLLYKRIANPKNDYEKSMLFVPSRLNCHWNELTIGEIKREKEKQDAWERIMNSYG